MFAVAETTGAGAAGDVPLKKKPKLVTTKGGAKAAAGTKTGTMVPATAGGAYVGGGGGAIVGGGAATTTTSTATANTTTGNHCKYHVKFLFLKKPKCSRGTSCAFLHQRNIKKGATVKADLLAWAKDHCENDDDYAELVTAIKNRT
jgi:hypothetical protein